MIKLFSISIPNDGAAEEELNRFLAAHRIVSVRSQWVVRRTGDEETPYQVFTMEYSGGAPSSAPAPAPSPDAAPARVDYRKILSQEQFVRYCKMRDERKKIADEEAVKAFVVFTNEQLAEIAKLEEPTLEAIRKIDGIGEARVTRYGARILEAAQTGRTGFQPVHRGVENFAETGKDARSPSLQRALPTVAGDGDPPGGGLGTARPTEEAVQ